jgi:hypothetical protein
MRAAAADVRLRERTWGPTSTTSTLNLACEDELEGLKRILVAEGRCASAAHCL